VCVAIHAFRCGEQPLRRRRSLYRPDVDRGADGVSALAALGTAAEQAGLRRRLHPGNGKRHVYSRLFLARLLIVLRDYQGVIDDLLEAIWSTNQRVANDNAATLTVSYTMLA
jgi:hypothetical protein